MAHGLPSCGGGAGTGAHIASRSITGFRGGRRLHGHAADDAGDAGAAPAFAAGRTLGTAAAADCAAHRRAVRPAPPHGRARTQRHHACVALRLWRGHGGGVRAAGQCAAQVPGGATHRRCALRAAGLVWAASYFGVLPAARLLSPPTEQPARRNISRLPSPRLSASPTHHPQARTGSGTVQPAPDTRTNMALRERATRGASYAPASVCASRPVRSRRMMLRRPRSTSPRALKSCSVTVTVSR